MNRLKYLFSNTIIIGIATICSKAIMYLLTPMYTYYMTKEQYGTADLVIMALNVVWPIFSLGVAEGVLRFSMSKEYAKEEVIGNSLSIIFRGFVAVILLTVIILVCYPEGRTYFWIFPILFWVATIQITLLNYCQGIGKIKLFMYNNILFALLLMAGAFIFIGKMRCGVLGYLLSYMIAYGVTAFFLARHCEIYKIKKECFSIRKSTIFKPLVRYSIPMVPMRISYWMISTSDRFMLSAFVGVGENGAYAAAYKIPTIVSVVVNIFVDSWKLSAIKEYEGESDEEFSNRVYRAFFLFDFLCGAGMIVICKFIAGFMLHEEFGEGWIYIPILLLAITLGNLQSYLTAFYVAAKETRRCFSTVTGGAIINVILNLVLIPRFAGMGAAIATTISYLLIYIIRGRDMKKMFHINPMFFKTILFSGLMIIEMLIIYKEVNHGFFINCGIVLCILMFGIRDIKEVFSFMVKRKRD